MRGLYSRGMIRFQGTDRRAEFIRSEHRKDDGIRPRIEE